MPKKPTPSTDSAKAPQPAAPKLTLLGRHASFPQSPSTTTLETFPNRYAKRDYWIRFASEDFTSLCPVTSQPDFAEITIDYIADELCIETKSLKYYLASFRNTPSFNEEIVNRILEDLVAVCKPRHLWVHGQFAQRGGIGVSVEAYYPEDARKPGTSGEPKAAGRSSKAKRK